MIASFAIRNAALGIPSQFNYESLLHDDATLALNLRQYVMGFSPNVREIFAAFNFDDTIRDLERAGLLYLLMERFNEKSKVDLRPASMSNYEMGYVFEHLLRKFNEALNQNPGEHFTPREVIRLMVDLVLMFDTDLASGEGVARTVHDCCCGTGGRLTLTKDRIQQINPQAKVFLYGQELNPQTWAIARSDMLILEPEGKDAENIKLGSTLSNDPLADKRFDFQFVNPPSGYEWSKDFDAVTTREPMQNNPSVRQRLGQRGLKPETLPKLLPSSFSLFTFPILANGSISSNQSGDCPRGAHSPPQSTNSQSLPRQRDIRQKLIEADLVDCMVALPS